MAMKLKEKLAEDDAKQAAPPRHANVTELPVSGVAAARRGKKATVGHFSEDMSRKLNALAAMNGRTLQSLMGEAWDDLLIKFGEKAFNER